MRCPNIIRQFRRWIMGSPLRNGNGLKNRDAIITAVDQAQAELSHEALKLRVEANNVGASLDDPLSIFTHSIRNARFQRTIDRGEF